MCEKMLMKGNEAAAEAALRAGCRFYYSYPITPQTEISEYLARHLPKIGGKFLQSLSEIAAINRVYGAAAAGARVMTSSSGPGMSLKQECISYMALAELPCVIVDVTRGGPGLGNLQASQADYFQIVKGGGHGDYHTIVLAPASAQEMADMTTLAFDLADKYRMPVIVVADAAIGQMMEPVKFRQKRPKSQMKSWALTGCHGRAPNIIAPFALNADELEKMNLKLNRKYQTIQKHEARFEMVNTDQPDIITIGYGLVARLLRAVIKEAKEQGIEVGLIRPITLWPFPEKTIKQATDHCQKILVVEMSLGQMMEDVQRAVNGCAMVDFYGRAGGMVPTSAEILAKIRKIIRR